MYNQTANITLVLPYADNEMDWDKVEEFKRIYQDTEWLDPFPPIQGYFTTLDESDLWKTFVTGQQVSEEDIGKEAFQTYDGHHRAYGKARAYNDCPLDCFKEIDIEISHF
jgi:hypothetical protein